MNKPYNLLNHHKNILGNHHALERITARIIASPSELDQKLAQKIVDIPCHSMYNTARTVPALKLGQIHVYILIPNFPSLWRDRW